MLSVNPSHSSADVTTLRATTCKLLPRKYRLTPVNPPAYPSYIGKTVPVGFGDLRSLADNRRSAVFYVRVLPRAPNFKINGWAWVGRPSGLPVPTFRFANPAQCPPTHLAMGSGLST